MPGPDLARDARMYLSRALNLSLAPPDWVSVNLTLQCNLKCVMCTTCYDVPRELDTAEVKDIIDQTALWGVRVFNPLGGEPFMRGDLEELLEHAWRKDFFITLTTNGTLINRRRAEMIARIPPDRLHFNLSLDGLEAVHDSVRGEGMFRRALAGYERLREADAAAGNPRRKVLANAILHRRNLEEYPALLDHLAERGFDGVQVLNLFRHGEAPPDDPGGMWIHPPQLPALERTVEELARRIQRQNTNEFYILNSESDIRLIPSYYRDGLRPLQAPCWSGWKELYINADGKVIMCDGQLDFLAGVVGDVRRQTLRQVWQSPELRARREVVKACQTPCIQSCYLRRDSDSAQAIGREALGRAATALRSRLGRLGRLRPRRHTRVADGVLTLELCDSAPWAAPWDPATLRRFEAFAAPCPAPIAACYADPTLWAAYRDRRYLDFGRGFMGFEVVRAVVEDLVQAGLVFPTLRLAWRGEPLMHPELALVLRWLLTRAREDGAFERLELRTDGRLLSPEVLSVVADFPELPQRWVVFGNGLAPHEDAALARWDALLAARGPATEVVACQVVDEDLDPYIFVETWRPRLRQPWLAAGRPRARGDGIWFARTDHAHFLANAEARRRLREVAEVLDLPPEAVDLGEEGPTRRCPGPASTPVVSWDGKLTLCPWDLTLQNRVGELTTDRLSRLWQHDPLLESHRREVQGRGVPGRPLCRDCAFVWSPNYKPPLP